jgi:hypothetical protein
VNISQLAFLPLGIALGLIACTSNSTEKASIGQNRTALYPDSCVVALPDVNTPSREGFFREVLFAKPTGRTAAYNDYTPGSYHVDKLDLAKNLPDVALRCGVTLRSLLVIGPIGDLWTFHVITFIQDGDSIRVTSLVMPHARITGKGTLRAARGRIDEALLAIIGSSLTHLGFPNPPDSLKDSVSRDFSYNLLLARYTDSSPRYWWAEFWSAERGDTVQAEVLRRMLTPLNNLLSGGRQTYPDTTGRSAPP